MAFTTVERKQRTARNVDPYIQWAEDIWPKRFLNYAQKSMTKYEKMQPQTTDESDKAYQLRCDETFQTLKQKWGSCDLHVLDCLDKAHFTRRHRKCEEMRRKDYEIYLDKLAFDTRNDKKEPLKPQFNLTEFPTLETNKNQENDEQEKEEQQTEDQKNQEQETANQEEQPRVFCPFPQIDIAIIVTKQSKKTSYKKFKANKSNSIEPPEATRPKIEKKKKSPTKEDLELDALIANIEKL